MSVGGGSRGLAISITEACPHIQATVGDLPNITEVTKNYIDEAVAGNRVNVVTADVIRESLAISYDAAVMSAFIQVVSPDDARCAIKNVSKVMNLGGEIYIRGYGIIDNSRTSPKKLVGFDLVYINVNDEGQAYTEQEHKHWLKEAGFGSFRRAILADGSSIITAGKPW